MKLSVYLMIFGAAVAASNDLAFDLMGYVYIMLNNVATAANGVCMKKKLDDAKSLGWFCRFRCAFHSLYIWWRTLVGLTLIWDVPPSCLGSR